MPKDITRTDSGFSFTGDEENEGPLRLPKADIEALGRVLEHIRHAFSEQTPTVPSGGLKPLLLAEEIYRGRRIRDDTFRDLDFSDPRWDMLLGLFIADARGQKILLSGAYGLAAAPATTGMRHLTALVESGIVRRINDESDSRSTVVCLTDEGRKKILSVLNAWGQHGSGPSG